MKKLDIKKHAAAVKNAWANVIFWAIVVIHLILLIFVKFTAWPEMLAWPHFILNGWLPYRDIAIAHTPLLLVDLTIFGYVFGVGVMQLKIFTWVLILLLDYLVYKVGVEFYGKTTATVALVFFMPLQILYEGNGLWFDLYMSAFALLTFYFLKKKKLFWAGVSFALAIMSKQTAVWFLLPILYNLLTLYTPLKEAPLKVAVDMLKGFALTFFSFIAILFLFGVLPDFYHWALDFGIFILPRSMGQISPPSFKLLLISTIPFLIFIPLVLRDRKNGALLALWAGAGAMGAYPRFELFHFQPALPFVALAFAITLIRYGLNRYIRYYVPVYLLLVSIIFIRFLSVNFGQETRFAESSVQAVSSKVRQLARAEQIYIANYWDSIYALTGTMPATRPFVPYLPWYLEVPGVGEEVISDLEEMPPKLIIEGEYTALGLGAYRLPGLAELINDKYELASETGGTSIYKLR